jgi:uncharacterized protein YukJ
LSGNENHVNTAFELFKNVKIKCYVYLVFSPGGRADVTNLANEIIPTDGKVCGIVLFTGNEPVNPPENKVESWFLFSLNDTFEKLKINEYNKKEKLKLDSYIHACIVCNNIAGFVCQHCQNYFCGKECQKIKH